MMNRIKLVFSPAFILLMAGAFITYWFRVYFTSENLPAVDLPSHFVFARQLRDHLLEGRIVFYDHTTFTGVPVFRFYSFLPALCTVLLSYPLELFASDPIVLSTHLILVLGMAIMPFTLYFAVWPLVAEISNGFDKQRLNQITVACLASAFAFWFINHDKQWHGIGAAAPMNIGLFAQVFGWHLFLVYLGYLARLRANASSRNFLGLGISYALLPISHTLTFVFVSFIGGLAFLFFGKNRRQIFVAHIMGFGLAGFWFWPTLSLLGTFTTYDVIRPEGDFLEILFRYPWNGLGRSIKSWFQGEFQTLEVIHLLQPFLVLTILLHPRINRQGTLFNYFLFGVLTVLLFSSGFIASSMPVGLHYYRFIAYEFLIFMVITCAVPMVFGVGSRFEKGIRLGICGLSIFSVYVNTTLPHIERQKIIDHKGEAYLSDENKVLDYFAGLPTKGRVYIEYLSNYDTYPFLSVHYVSSKLYPKAGFEAVVNSHLQESMSYRMLVASAKLLGAKTYNPPLLFTDHAGLDDPAKIEQLRAFGVTHVICAEKKFCNRLYNVLEKKPVKIGRYKIFTLLPDGFAPVQSAEKILIGYKDEKGTLPYYFIQYYFYGKQALFYKYHLLDLTKESQLPAGVKAVIINSSDPKSTGSFREDPGVKFHRADYTPKLYSLNHYDVHYPHNLEFDRYLEAEIFLNNFVVRSGLPYAQVPPKVEPTYPEFIWSQDGQSFEIRGVTPGKIYRVNYSYFPYWQIEGGRSFRGSEERLFIEAEGTTIKGHFTPWSAVSSYVGLMFTIISGLFAFAVFRRSR
jgi:hypothetical protein